MYVYRIAVNFRGSKFSRMAVFEDFNNFANSLSKPCACRTRNVVWPWHTNQVLSNTHCRTVVRARARSCQQSNAYFEDISLEGIACGFGSMLSIDALAHEN